MALNDLGNVAAGSTIPLYWTSHDAATGATETMSGLAVTDVEIYKGTSITQRSSDNGYALIDTDGIDVDSVTGLNAISIDLSDNSDAGFFAAGSFYNVILTPVTVDGQTLTIHLATFYIVAADPLTPTTAGRTLDVSAGGEAGVDWANVGSPTTAVDLSGTNIKTNQKVDIETIKTNPVVNGGTITFPTTATLASTTNITAGTMTTVTTATTATNLTNAPTNGDFTATMKTSIGTAVAASAVASVTGNVGGNVTGTVGSVVGAVGSVTGAVGSVTGAVGSVAAGGIAAASFAAGAIDATAIATNAFDADALAADAVTEIWAKAMTDLAAVPAINGTALQALNWLFVLARNQIEQTATTTTARKDDSATAIAAATVSDNGTVFTRGKFA